MVMLRILRTEPEEGVVVLVLEGHVAGEWVELLDRECSDVRRSGSRVSLDLSGVTFIGRSGLETLGRLGRGGVEVRGCSPLIADMLEQEGIEPRRTPDAVSEEELPGKRGGAADA